MADLRSTRVIDRSHVSVADQADSDLNGKLLRAAEYLLRRSGVSRPSMGSAKEALDVVQVKSREGWDGLRRMLDG